MASTYLSRTLGTSTNVYKGTVSHWVKRAGLGAMGTFAAWNNGVSDTNRAYLNFNNDDIYFYDQANSMILETNRKFRDTSAWYHIVCAWDTSQGTAADRVKIYVNGVQETSFSTANYPSVNSTLQFNTSGRTFGLGSYAASGAAAGFFDGSMANVEFVDGQQLTPAYFGSTDSTTGIWTPQASSTISSYGTNGFKLKMDTATPGADTSGNTNTFTVGAGTPTLTQGSPSNVYANINSIGAYRNQPTLSNGNLTLTGTGSSTTWNNTVATLGTTQGKWYYEFKITGASQFLDIMIGIINTSKATNPTTNLYTQNGSCYYYGNDGGEIRQDGGETFNNYGAFAQNDIIGIAYDLDTYKFNVYQNGNQIVTNFALSSNFQDGGFIIPSILVYEQSVGSANFGEGFFGTTAAGTQADDNGQGLFAYDVPSGYYAMNTKNLEAYG